MATKGWRATSLIGGGAGALDAIDGDLLVDLDLAIVNTASMRYVYSLDDDLNLAESSPQRIVPDTNPGTKVWVLIDSYPIALQNLLTNSLFGAWSNSGDMYTTAGTVPASGDGYAHDTETCDDDAVDDESADWAETGGGTITYDVNIYDFDGSAANEYVHSAADFAVLTAGKLYEMQIYFADEAAPQTVQMGVFTTGAGAFTAIGPDITTAGGGATYNRVFESDGTERRIGFKVTSNPAGANKINWKDTLLHEVTPGCVAENDLAIDGWGKTATAAPRPDIWRMHSDGATESITKLGSFYAVKIVSDAVADSVLFYPTFSTNLEWVARFPEQIVTFAAYVKSATTAALCISETDHNIRANAINTSVHTGGGDWEWLEVTATFSNAPAHAAFFLNIEASATAYISQPMLVFGSSIGEGNFSSPPGEEIRFEADVVLTDYDGGAGDIAADVDAAINIEAQSNGKIPKGIAEIYVNVRCWDSAAATDFGVWMGPDTTYCAQDIGDVGAELNAGVGNDEPIQAAGWVRCNPGGDPWLFINQSGAGLLDAEIRVTGVKLK